MGDERHRGEKQCCVMVGYRVERCGRVGDVGEVLGGESYGVMKCAVCRA